MFCVSLNVCPKSPAVVILFSVSLTFSTKLAGRFHYHGSNFTSSSPWRSLPSPRLSTSHWQLTLHLPSSASLNIQFPICYPSHLAGGVIELKIAGVAECTHTQTHTLSPQPLLCCFFGILIGMHVVVLQSLVACQACESVWAATTCFWCLWIIYEPWSFLRVKSLMLFSRINLSQLGLQRTYRSNVIRQEDELLVCRHLEFSSSQVL